jgi:hypothetical protein
VQHIKIEVDGRGRKIGNLGGLSLLRRPKRFQNIGSLGKSHRGDRENSFGDNF